MIECSFSIDYEIYGSGEGSLRELVYEPAEKLRAIFNQAGAKLVVFVEAAELEQIERFGTDPGISDVQRQICELHADGHEIALHLHPQWRNARYENAKWELDYGEYNLCTLPEGRIAEIVDGAIAYLRSVLKMADFKPFSFRAGNWLFQPTRAAARVLASRGLKVDSSVFKGGVQHQHNLDYRRAARNGYYWKFQEDVNVPDAAGALLEMPIYTRMTPFWKMVTGKRLALQQKGASGTRTFSQKFYRLLDLARFKQPLKFDFCRMTLEELESMIDFAVREDQHSPASFKPLVAIGHTKDLVDLETVNSFLGFLKKRGIAIATLQEAYHRCSP